MTASHIHTHARPWLECSFSGYVLVPSDHFQERLSDTAAVKLPAGLTVAMGPSTW